MKKSLTGAERVYLDANIFIYADLAGDELGESARGIIESSLERKFKGVTCTLTIDEVMWSIWSEESRQRAVKVSRSLLRMANLEVVEVGKDEMRIATDAVESHGLKPRDAIHYAAMMENDVTRIASEDSDFDIIPDIRRAGISEFAEELGEDG